MALPCFTASIASARVGVGGEGKGAVFDPPLWEKRACRQGHQLRGQIPGPLTFHLVEAPGWAPRGHVLVVH